MILHCKIDVRFTIMQEIKRICKVCNYGRLHGNELAVVATCYCVKVAQQLQ